MQVFGAWGVLKSNELSLNSFGSFEEVLEESRLISDYGGVEEVF